MKAISQSELHIATGGVHSVGLFDQKGALCIIDDIGRHNAMDKAIGCALTRDVDLSQTYAACTGRIPQTWP
jgi:FdhD protein